MEARTRAPARPPPSTIHGNRLRGTGILNNELYIGRLVWNRLRYVKDPETGKRVSRLNPDSGWIVQSVPGLRIVDQELWERVKTRQGTLEAGCGSGEKPVSNRNTPRGCSMTKAVTTTRSPGKRSPSAGIV